MLKDFLIDTLRLHGRTMIRLGFHGARHRLADVAIVQWLNRMDQIKGNE